MKTNIKRAVLAFAALAASCLYACKKEDSQKASANLLTTATWKFSKMEWQTTAGAWVAPPSWAGTSRYPQTFTLLDNNTYSTGTSSGSFGTWQLSADKAQLILFTNGGSSVTYNIGTLTASTIQFLLPMDEKTTYTIEGSGPTRTYTYYNSERATFTH